MFFLIMLERRLRVDGLVRPRGAINHSQSSSATVPGNQSTSLDYSPGPHHKAGMTKNVIASLPHLDEALEVMVGIAEEMVDHDDAL